MSDVAKSYERISTLHSKLILAFEYRENHNDESKLMELLDEWRGFFVDMPQNDGDDIISRNNLRLYEKELYEAYSPNEIANRINDICLDVRGFLFRETNEMLLKNDDALLVSRLLCNCQLLMNCFFPLFEEQYDNHVSNVLNKLNQCIVISQSDYFSEYYRHMLFSFNDEFASVKEASAHIFHVIGVLNFKCHNYGTAIEFFKKAITNFEQMAFTYKSNEYFQTRLLYAYCFEYDHQFEPAIQELVGLSITSIVDLFIKSGFNMFDLLDSDSKNRAKSWSENFINNILMNKIRESAPNALFAIAEKRDSEIWRQVGDRHEILHSFAHCLNELGIKWRTENGKEKKSVKHLLSLARALMLYVAEYDVSCVDFQTCLYMIYGEAKDYDICLTRIRQLMDLYDSELPKSKNINYEMENMFYLFLVLNQSNKTLFNENKTERALADEAYKKFVSFAKSRYDYDALIHIEIFKYRFEIVYILRTSFNSKEVAERLKALKESPVGKHVFAIKPSTKLNQWIIQEYNKTVALYEFLLQYFSDTEEVNINELYNFATRFEFYRNFFSTETENTKRTKGEAISSVIEAIVDDFVSPQSIFLLAPITTAMPYQHQAENLSSLEDSLCEILNEKISQNAKIDRFEELNEFIPDTTDEKSIRWLFAHREYGVFYVAYKRNSDVTFDRYRFCLNANETYERPILNLERVNALVLDINRESKAHNVCRNGQQKCCTTVITDYNKKRVEMLCDELMIPVEKCRDKHFIFFLRGKTINSNSHAWYIIAVDNELCPLQIEEVRFKLCGHGFEPGKKLAISNNEYCYISFGISDIPVVKNDLIALQENWRVRFWFNKSIFETETWNEGAFQKMDAANCIVFFASQKRIEREATELYRELLHAINQNHECIIVPIGFHQKGDFVHAVKMQFLGMERCEDVTNYLDADSTTFAFRKQDRFDYTEHLSENGILLSKLKSFEVVRYE